MLPLPVLQLAANLQVDPGSIDWHPQTVPEDLSTGFQAGVVPLEEREVSLERPVVHLGTQERSLIDFANLFGSYGQRQWGSSPHRHCPVLFAAVGLSHSSEEVPVVGESEAEPVSV